MCLPLFSKFSPSWELYSFNVLASEIGTKGGKESMVVNLSSYFCILTIFLEFFLQRWDSVFRLSQEVDGCYVNLHRKHAVLCESREAPAEACIS